MGCDDIVYNSEVDVYYTLYHCHMEMNNSIGYHRSKSGTFLMQSLLTRRKYEQKITAYIGH